MSRKCTLVRAAILSIGGAPLTRGFDAVIGGVTISALSPLRVDGKDAGTLVLASKHVDDLADVASGSFNVDVVRSPLREMEAALEVAGSLHAVDAHMGLQLE